jgi:hypothetical protein
VLSQRNLISSCSRLAAARGLPEAAARRRPEETAARANAPQRRAFFVEDEILRGRLAQ